MIKGMLPKELEEAFRRRAMGRYGYTKGAVSRALEDAIKLWLRYDYEENDEEKANNKAFESLSEELESKHAGMYAVIAGGRLVAVHTSLREALQSESRYSHRLIFKIGEKPSPKVRLGWRAKISPAGTI